MLLSDFQEMGNRFETGWYRWQICHSYDMQTKKRKKLSTTKMQDVIPRSAMVSKAIEVFVVFSL